MNLVNTKEELFAGIQRIKAKANSFITNFYRDEGKLERWIKNKILFTLESNDGMLLFRKSGSFYHLYYFVNSVEQLNVVLKGNTHSQKLVLDIIGNTKMAGETNKIKAALAQNGFSNYTTLQRCARINTETSNCYAAMAEVTIAEPRHSAEIMNMLKANFDPYSEQLPDIEEIEGYILNKNIIIVEENGVLKGFLINTRNGYTSILNNFLVGQAYRSEKIGSKLLKHFIHSTADCKRILLWVLENNDNAIAVYKHHGFVADNLVDYVMTN